MHTLRRWKVLWQHGGQSGQCLCFLWDWHVLSNSRTLGLHTLRCWNLLRWNWG